tara:strand:- start:164 stop:505 length:342 start_codon:yes stop_codon:yes gene_type:complete
MFKSLGIFYLCAVLSWALAFVIFILSADLFFNGGDINDEVMICAFGVTACAFGILARIEQTSLKDRSVSDKEDINETATDSFIDPNKCRNCGNKLQPDQNFCEQCGAQRTPPQ